MAKKYRHYPHIIVVDTCALMHDEKITLPRECKVHVPKVVWTELMYLSGLWQSRRLQKQWGADVQAQARDALLGVLLNLKIKTRGEREWWSIVGSDNVPQSRQGVMKKIRRDLLKKLSPEDRTVLLQAYVATKRAGDGMSRVTLVTRDRALQQAARKLKINVVESFLQLHDIN